jgi:hypothetical protein
MSRHASLPGFLIVVAVACTLVVPLAAQQAPAEGPTAKNPLRFTAFAVSMQAGVSGSVDIAIERWTTDQERETILNILATQGQSKLLDAFQAVKGRNGYIRTTRSLSWDLKYARENILPDGTRQIVIATDKPVSFLAASSGARVMDYPFTLIEMRFGKGKEGEGRMLVATSIGIKNKTLELENYGQEPVRLTSITEEKRK